MCIRDSDLYDGHYHIDFERFSKDIRGCRLLILCNPHNPGGRVLKDSLPVAGWKNEIWKDGIANIDEMLNGPGKVVTDPTSGFRACNKDAIDLFCKSYPDDYPEPESILSLIHI